MKIARLSPIENTRAFAGRLLAGAVLCSLASLSPANAQGTGQASGPSAGAGNTASQGAPSQQRTDAGKGSQPQSMGEQDRELIEDLAHANLAEIETGRLALEKSTSPQVKQFAQRMIDDHTNAMKQLQQLAQRKGAEVPRETDFQHKAIATALRLLDGNTFDEQYMRHVGVNDHRRTVDLLEKTQRTARDPDLKGYARKTLPTVQKHLAMARQMTGRDAAAGRSGETRGMGASGQQQPGQAPQQPSGTGRSQPKE